MSNNFRVGQKVVCIGLYDNQCPNAKLVSKGMVYTVTGTPKAWNGEVCLELYGIHPKPCSCFHFPAFSQSCFRPAVDKPASIEVFRKMLVPSGVNA